MRKQTKKSKKQTPRTNIRWKDDAEYSEALSAAGNLPLASHVRDVYLRAIRNNHAA